MGTVTYIGPLNPAEVTLTDGTVVRVASGAAVTLPDLDCAKLLSSGQWLAGDQHTAALVALSLISRSERSTLWPVAVRQVASDRLRLFESLGSERFWGIDLWQTTGLPGAGGISGYVAPHILSRAAIYEPFVQLGAFARNGSGWGSHTVQAAASGGGYYFSTTVGDTVTATIPANATKVGLRSPAVSNAGFARVRIAGDPTRANRLSTAQQLVDSGRLAGLGTLAPTDRILDLYAAASDAATTADYDRHFILADLSGGGSALAGNSITLEVLAEKNFASTGTRLYIADDPFTYATAVTTHGTYGANLLPTTRLLSHLDSAYEYAHEVGIPGTLTFIGNVHGYETETAFTVAIDGRSLTLAVGETVWGNRIDVSRDTNLYHPAVGAGNTVIGAVKTFYTMSSLGLDVYHRTTWAQAVTLNRDYTMMFPGDGPLFSSANVAGSTYTLGANDGSYKGQVAAALAKVTGTDGGLTIVHQLAILDPQLSVDSFALSAPMNTAVEDRTPTNANVGNIKKIYVARVHTGSPLAVASGTVQHSTGNYRVLVA
jgi:hypothetical protein